MQLYLFKFKCQVVKHLFKFKCQVMKHNFSNVIQEIIFFNFRILLRYILLRYRQWNVPGAPAAHSGKVKDKSKTNYFPEASFNVYFMTVCPEHFYSSAGETFKMPLDNSIGFHTNAAEFLFQPEVVKDRQDQDLMLKAENSSPPQASEDLQTVQPR